MKHLGLFEGIGGFSLAARWMGWETVAWCEWNPFSQEVLRTHFPAAKGHGNIKETDFTQYAKRIDILTGGFPCQPYSIAGKRKGTEDDRHLWPEMLRAIREVKAPWIVGENVPGIVNWGGDWYSRMYKLTWKMKGTKYRRIYFQLRAKTRNTNETDVGLLPTPTATDFCRIRFSDDKIKNSSYNQTINSLHARLLKYTTEGQNPENTELLMRYPLHWTNIDFKLSETQ